MITLNQATGQVCWEIAVANIGTATAAHIHRGPAGVDGPIVIPLSPPVDGFATACVTDVDRALVREILQSPDQFYVNVHTVQLPAGAVRGQLRTLGGS